MNKHHITTITVCFRVLLLMLVTFIGAEAQQGLIPAEYLKIKPGVSTRADVEQLLSKKESDQDFVEYEKKHFTVSVSYSSGSCRTSPLGLPEGTVDQVHYSLAKNALKNFRSIVLKPSAFVSGESGDVVQDESYVNAEFGIRVVYDRYKKKVLHIVLTAPAAIAKKFDCSEQRVKK